MVLTHGIPAHDTIQRVMSMIDGSILYRLCIPFLLRRLDILAATAREWRMTEYPGALAAPKLIVIDGKTSRRSKRNKTDRDAVRVLHTVSACSTDRGLCLSEVAADEQTNKIPAVRDLLDITDVRGCVVTWDALNT